MGFTPGNKAAKGFGRPAKNNDVVALARSYTQRAIRCLVQVMDDEDAPPASRVSAATAILDRGWCRPAQAVVGADGGPVALQISWLPVQPAPPQSSQAASKQ
jgi:hypothetical protein